jgi:ATP-dependent DNA helicase PIF1
MPLTKYQKYAIRRVLAGKSTYIAGDAGTGKSFVIGKLHEAATKRGWNCVITSTSGISASHIPGAWTFQSWSGVGMMDRPLKELYYRVMRNKEAIARIRAVDILVIEEVSMMSDKDMTILGIIIQAVRREKTLGLFGSVIMVPVGDMFQLPPPGGQGHNYAFEGKVWAKMGPSVVLKKSFRQKNAKFFRILGKIKVGNIDAEVKEAILSRLTLEGSNLVVNGTTIRPSILYSKKDGVRRKNNDEFSKLIKSGETPHEYTSNYKYETMSLVDLTLREKSSLRAIIDKSTALCEEMIMLCKGCQVILTKNKRDLGLSNGSRGTVIGFSGKYRWPIVQFVSYPTPLIIRPQKWTIEVGDHTVTKTQIPLKWAWALTIHKSQGMSLDFVQTNLGRSIFACGQVYVALSRARTLAGLFIEEMTWKSFSLVSAIVLEFHKKCLAEQVDPSTVVWTEHERNLLKYGKGGKPKSTLKLGKTASKTTTPVSPETTLPVHSLTETLAKIHKKSIRISPGGPYNKKSIQISPPPYSKTESKI